METNYSRNDLTKIFAFCALILSAIIWVLVAPGIITGTFLDVLIFIKDVALLIAIAIPALSFAKSMSNTWVIVIWVIIIASAVSLIIGNFII
ncbi:MAG: hypothetical protein GX304_03820 [Clostridiales bacterium]|jgi:hypothetical protein|nr:hypothetical protein [Clostridiales bacterium]